MDEIKEIERFAESAYLSVCEDRHVKFSSLYNSAKVFYFEVAQWHMNNNNVEGDLSKIASKMFDGVMILEQRRREEKEGVQHGGLFVMDEKVKRMYFNLAKWHVQHISI